jgi:hypothetical protein
MGREVLTPGWQEVIAQRKGFPELLREAKPRLQQIVDEHLRRVSQTRPGWRCLRSGAYGVSDTGPRWVDDLLAQPGRR